MDQRLKEAKRQRLDATQVDFLRRSCEVSRMHGIKINEMKKRMNVQTIISEEMEGRKLK